MSSTVIPTDLSNKVRVIGGGHPRTGTVSFNEALAILLRGPTLHSGSASLLREEAVIKGWIDVLDRSTETRSHENSKFIRDTLRHICQGYVAVTDAPASMLVEELLDAYPDAIVVITTRDTDKWWASFEAVKNQVFAIKALSILFTPLATVRYFGTWIDAMVRRSNFLFAEDQEEYEVTREHLARHENYVKRVTPPEKLHYFDVKDGWEPLCAILGVPVPSVPFPHANDAQAVQKILEGLVRRALYRWMLIIGITVALGFLVRSLFSY